MYENYDIKISKLKERLSNLVDLNFSVAEAKNKKIFFKKSISKVPSLKKFIFLIYFIIPLVIGLILFILKPKFVSVKMVDKDNNVFKKLNFSKFLKVTLFLGIILDVILFFVLRKFNK